MLRYRSFFRSIAAPALNSGTHTIQGSGKSRGFTLKIPDNYDNNHPYRLAFGYVPRGDRPVLGPVHRPRPAASAPVAC